MKSLQWNLRRLWSLVACNIHYIIYCIHYIMYYIMYYIWLEVVKAWNLCYISVKRCDISLPLRTISLVCDQELDLGSSKTIDGFKMSIACSRANGQSRGSCTWDKQLLFTIRHWCSVFLCIAVSNTDPDTCAPEVKPHLSITEPLLRWKFRAFCRTMLFMYLGTAMTLA